MRFIRELIWPSAPPADCTLGEWSDWDEAMRLRIHIYIAAAIIGAIAFALTVNAVAP